MADMTPFEVRYYSIYQKTRVNDTECYDLHVFANDALAEIARLTAERDGLRRQIVDLHERIDVVTAERDAAIAEISKTAREMRDAAWNEAIEAAAKLIDDQAKQNHTASIKHLHKSKSALSGEHACMQVEAYAELDSISKEELALVGMICQLKRS